MLADDGPMITTRRLKLSPFSSDDTAEHFEAVVSQPRVARWLPGGLPGTPDQASALTAAFAAHWDQRGYGVFVVRDRDTGRFVGRCGLRYLPELDDVELLYAFRPKAWGRGLATEAARACVDDGFDRVGLPHVIALVLPDNTASLRVLERTGMSPDGQLTIFGLHVTRFRLVNDRQV